MNSAQRCLGGSGVAPWSGTILSHWMMWGDVPADAEEDEQDMEALETSALTYSLMESMSAFGGLYREQRGQFQSLLAAMKLRWHRLANEDLSFHLDEARIAARAILSSMV